MAGYFCKLIKFAFFIVLLLTSLQCSKKAVSELPKDILGIGIGMNKDNAEQRLREIGKLSREEVRQQQVWSVRDDSHFGSVAIGYDKENRVRYIAGIAKIKGGELMRFSQVGDVSAAKAEIVEPNRKYVWEAPAENDSPSRTVIAQGNNADYLSMLTLVNSSGKKEEDDDEEEERREREEHE